MPKFAVITGASSGIGAEFARQLSARGYQLLLVARRTDRLEQLSAQLTTVCEIFPADLSRTEECCRLADALRERQVDLFINNAGFGDCGPFLETELDKELRMVDVNVRAVQILTKRMVQQMERQGSGALLNVGSSAGLLPGGPYIISSATFPGYFTKGQDTETAQTRLDAVIYAQKIAPRLGITVRYVGEEPYCQITSAYNTALQEILPQHGIAVKVVPRCCSGGEIVSASTVREKLRQDDWDGIRRLVPDSTYQYLVSGEADAIIARIKQTASRH